MLEERKVLRNVLHICGMARLLRCFRQVATQMHGHWHVSLPSHFSTNWILQTGFHQTGSIPSLASQFDRPLD